MDPKPHNTDDERPVELTEEEDLVVDEEEGDPSEDALLEEFGL